MDIPTQIHLIRVKLEGHAPPGLDPAMLDEPWRTIYTRLAPGTDPAELGALLLETLAHLPGGSELGAQVIRLLTEPLTSPATCHTLHDLAPRLPPVEWLWPGWLPRGFLSLLGAAPGAGKSLVALDLARRVIHGLPFPDGASPAPGVPAEPGGAAVLYVDSEMAPQVLRDRASAWEIDTRRLFTLLPPASSDVLDLCDSRHQAHLMRVIASVRPRLVVVDSLSSSTGKGENNVEQVRAFLSFLATLARIHGTALLLIHHLRKRERAPGARSRPHSGAITAQEFRGSGHITAVPRSVLALSVVQTGPEPDPDNPRRFEVIKSNLGPCPPPLGIYLQPGQAGAPVLSYAAAPHPYRPPTQVDACAEWLQGLLAASPHPLAPRDVLSTAAGFGFKHSVVYEARRRLEGIIVDTDTRHAPTNRWRLAARPAPPSGP